MAATKKPTKTKQQPAAAAKKPGPRADLGAPIEGYFDRQPPPTRKILDAFRALIDAAVPGAQAAIKWGMPMWTLQGQMVCALRVTRAHVGLIVSGPPERFDDPDGRLEGEGKMGRQLKVTEVAEIPKKQVTAWLKAAARG